MHHSRNDNKDDRDVPISKSLAWLLRHAAVKEGLPIKPDGFIPIKNLLHHKRLKSKCTETDIIRIVNNNDKQRFALRRNEAGELEIRANQGHSISIDNLELTPITDPKQVETVVHGTYLSYWPSIKKEGLHKRTRNHIHFAIGLPTENQVISGARKSVEVFIYIDLAKALDAGLKFFLSENKVVLSPGNRDGIIEPKFFLKAVKTKTGELLEL